MPGQHRFDLPFLRSLQKHRGRPDQAGLSNEFKLSRRHFLGVSTIAGAGATIPPFLFGDGFSVVQDGSTVHVLVRKEPRWSIDPSRFGPSARVALAKTPRRFELALSNASFPGTQISANFRAQLARTLGRWILEMEMDCGIHLEAPLLEWLDTRQMAVGEWRIESFTPCDGFRINFRRPPEVRFSPNWNFELNGPTSAKVRGFDDSLESNSTQIELRPERQIASGQRMLRTLFRLQRGRQLWSLDMHQSSTGGWSLKHDHELELFDELQVETAQNTTESVCSGLFLQKEENEASLHLETGGGLISDSGSPFHLSLDNPRFAFSLNDTSPTSALVADLREEVVWAHGEHASYQLAPIPAAPHFELIDPGGEASHPKIETGICQICFPDDTSAINLKFGVPRPFRLTWADITGPFQRLWGILRLSPSKHDLDIEFSDNPIPDHVLEIDRPSDLFSLQFQFKNMRLITGLNPKIVLRDQKKDGLFSVIFPPQHIAEEAFFHTDDGPPLDAGVPIGPQEVIDRGWAAHPPTVTTCEIEQAKQKLDHDYVKPSPVGCPPNPNCPPQSTTKNKDGVRPRTLLSGASRLVFGIPEGKSEIPFHLGDLLDWTKWEPRVAEVAQTNVDVSNYDRIPAIVEPKDITAIELPYKVILSPSELGRWVHSIEPVKHNTSVVELWHTRLAVAAQGAVANEKPVPPDDGNAKDRTVRAIWSPDYVAVDRTCSADPAMVARSDAHLDGLGFPVHYTTDADPDTYDDPFRMSLDSRDRCELVHLTSNYRIPRPASTCAPKPTAQQLLPPAPVAVERMLLTSIGGYLKSSGVWEPAKVDANHQLTVEQWRHIATLGRDHYVRVVYKGYLLPFGHRASLIKVTERKITNKSHPENGFVAILHQRMFIVVHDPIKTFPVLGQPVGGRQIPFRRVEALTLVTPDIDLPQGYFPANPKRTQTQSLFWPMVNNQAFRFRFRFTDMAGMVSEASFPVVFADAAVSQSETNSTDASPLVFGPQDAIDLYNAGTGKASQTDDDWTTASFSDQKVAFATPSKPGDTQYDAGVLAFSAISPPCEVEVGDLYANDLPYFYPKLAYARISSSSIKRVTGKFGSTRVVFFPAYLEKGFDPQENRGEVVLQVDDENPLPLAFGVTGSVDKAGGLASPDIKVAGFSRKSGPVGGTPALVGKGAPAPPNPVAATSLTTYSSGNFNAGDFFSGLTSAKILGGIKLSDIIAPLSPGLASNLEKAPQMLEKSVFAIEDVIEKDVIPAIELLQTNPLPAGIQNPLASHLAPQAQQVFAFNAARKQARTRTASDPDGSAALLADTIAEADVDRQLVGAIKDYVNALEVTLSNPSALAEEALVDFLTALLSQTITDAGLAVETQFATFVGSLQNDLRAAAAGAAQSALGQATAALQVLAAVAFPLTDLEKSNALIPDTLQMLLDPAGKAATLPFSLYAPDLVSVCNVINTASDLQKRIGDLSGSVARADIPGFFEQLNSSLDDLSQIYQSAGFVGIVTTNQSVIDEIRAAQSDISSIWQQVPFVANLISSATTAAAEIDRIKKEIQDLEDACLKLAAKATTDCAKKVLQNLRQVQQAVVSIESYQKQLRTLASLTPDAGLRLNQLLQQLQRQILASLATLQTMATPLSSAELRDAAAAAGVPLIALATQLTQLALDLTAADPLIAVGGQPPLEARMAQSFAKLVPPAPGMPAVGNLLADPLNANYKSISDQLSGLRTNKLTGDPGNLSLKLLHYDLSLQLQSPFDVGQQWSVFSNLRTVSASIQTALTGLTKISAFSDAISQRISKAISAVLCPLKTIWDNFSTRLSTANSTVYNLFRPSLGAVSGALQKLCDDAAPPAGGAAAPLPSPSVLIADARNVFAAFQVLLNDVRSRVTSLANVPQEVMALAKQQLDKLIRDIPVPKSITLSYDWHPQIQPFQPVFLLNDGADFAVSARAEVSLPLPGANPPSFDITASLSNFSINLIGNPSFVVVTINSLKFTSHNGSSPDCRIDIKAVDFGRDMSFVKSLAAALNPSKGPFIELSDGAIKAGFRFAVDSLPSAGMTVMGLAIEVAVALPFNGDPVRCEFGISDQQHPFLLSFGIYGGGGFLQLQLGLDGVQLLQGALEFGLVSSISIGPLRGDGFIVGGIYFRIARNDARVCGFVHAHGHMDIFGIVSLDVDLYVGVCYNNGVVTGTATFSIHVSILFFSEDFSLQASYTFGGSSGRDSQNELARAVDPRYERGALATAAFLDSPADADQTGVPPPSVDPVFISEEDWISYLNAFDLEPQGAQS